MAILFPLPSSKARVRAMSSANWAEVPGGRGLASMVSKLEATAYPALLFPSKTELLPSVCQKSSLRSLDPPFTFLYEEHTLAWQTHAFSYSINIIWRFTIFQIFFWVNWESKHNKTKILTLTDISCSTCVIYNIQRHKIAISTLTLKVLLSFLQLEK